MSDIVKKFVGFAKNYGDEALAVAEALNTMLGGLALSNEDQRKVTEIINKLENAHANISASKPPAKITIKKSDIEAAVASVLPGILNDLVTEAVTKALAENAAEDAKENTDA